MTRADGLSELLVERGLDALIVTDAINTRYLTGFTGSNALAVVGPEVRRFITDFRYVERAADEVRGFDREEGPRELLDALKGPWPAGARVGYEDHKVSVRREQQIASLLPNGVELVAAGGLVEQLRALKDPGELDRIRSAARLADAALAAVLERGLCGRSEAEVGLDLEFEIRRLGADAVAFPPIVASAEHGALPHAVPRDVEIAPDTLVTIDWGAQLDGYASDCTRTFATGELSDAQSEIYAVVERAQRTSLDAVRPGPTGAEVDAVARDIISAAGHGEHFGHGLGHGVGLEVHEDPRLTRADQTPLAPGHVVTVEPGVYVPGVGGVRIEDLVFVTEGGHEVASSLTKSLQRVR